MPAEKVYGMQTISGGPKEAIPGEPLEPEPAVPIVDVRWNRLDGYVQMVTKCEDAFGGRLAKDDPGVHYTDGMYVDLGREAINQLIRNLRRARDQAFGRDE